MSGLNWNEFAQPEWETDETPSSPDNTPSFEGFRPATSNFSHLPHQLIDAFPLFETKAELMVVLYILRHTWGFHDDDKKITLDEFENGRKRKDDTRLDNGVGMSRPSIMDGLVRAERHGFICIETDESDKGRIKKYYSLRGSQGLNNFTPDVKKSYPSGKEILPRSEKETSRKKPKIKDSATQGARRKAKPQTPRPTPQNYAEKSGLPEDVLEAQRQQAIRDSIAQTDRQLKRSQIEANLYEAVFELWGIKGDANSLAGTMVRFFLCQPSKAAAKKQNGWATNFLDEPLTAEDVRNWAALWRNQTGLTNLPGQPDLLAGKLNAYIAMGKPRLDGSQNGTQQNQTDLDRAAQSSTESQDEAAAYWREHPEEYATYAAQYPQGGLF